MQNKEVSTVDFYEELAVFLACSDGNRRKNWAQKIIKDDVDIEFLSNLLLEDNKTANRFLWLLSDVGISSPLKLKKNLPFLYEFMKVNTPDFLSAFASYFLYVGVPEEMEGIAMNLMFQLLNSKEINQTLKARASLVLFELSKKFPEIKNELIISLENQQDKYTNGFSKRVSKIVKNL